MRQRGRIWEPAARWASAPYLWDREHGKRKSMSKRKSKADSIRAVVEGKRGCKKYVFCETNLSGVMWLRGWWL